MADMLSPIAKNSAFLSRWNASGCGVLAIATNIANFSSAKFLMLDFQLDSNSVALVLAVRDPRPGCWSHIGGVAFILIVKSGPIARLPGGEAGLCVIQQQRKPALVRPPPAKHTEFAWLLKVTSALPYMMAIKPSSSTPRTQAKAYISR